MKISVLLGGDMMLGRLVREAMQEQGIHYPLQNIKPLLQQADLTIVNLECAITDYIGLWHGEEKVFYFGSLPEAAVALSNAGVKVVSLANNHILDFDVQGLLDTLLNLNEQEIDYAGAGKNLSAAKTPCKIKVKHQTFTMMAYCDHQQDFTATDTSPGMNFLDCHHPTSAIEQLAKDFEQHIDPTCDWPILSLHWGPNMVLHPSPTFVDIAHAAIDMGYKIIFGHSAHVFHGIEFYRSCPIIYAVGDLVDDYAIDPYFRNDHGLLFKLIIDDDRVTQITCYPIFLEFCYTVPANEAQFEFIANRFTEQCEQFGTLVETKDDKTLVIANNGGQA